jgi:16S rRNA (adenine1518-N6/adenine1519-N6)-dimethyltransferase
LKKVGTSKTIQEAIKSNEFRIKKKYGQNFLIDQNILEKIVNEANISKDTLVVEIGPGFGSLTEHLTYKAGHVIAYEIDSDFIQHLNKTFEKEDLTLINEDFLKRDIDVDIKEKSSDYNETVVVANLPYYITTPIIMKILEESKIIDRLVIMMQLEVARRVTSKPKTKDYNSLSIAIQYQAEANFLFKVPKNVFIPAPRVESAIIEIKKIKNKPKQPKNEQFFFSLVRKSFTQRRKTLANNISKAFNISKIDLYSIFSELGYKDTVRAEELNVGDFIDLSDILEKRVNHN